MTVWMPPEWVRPGGEEPADGPAQGVPRPRAPADAVETGGPASVERTEAARVEPVRREAAAPAKTPWPWFAVRAEEAAAEPDRVRAAAESAERADLDPPTAIMPAIRIPPEPPSAPGPGPGVRSEPPGGQDGERRPGRAGNGAPGNGDAGSGAGDVDGPGGVRSDGDAVGPARDGMPAGGAPGPLPKRVPQTPPPPFGVAVTSGGASLFQQPARSNRLREPMPEPVVRRDAPVQPPVNPGGWGLPAAPSSGADPSAGRSPHAADAGWGPPAAPQHGAMPGGAEPAPAAPHGGAGRGAGTAWAPAPDENGPAPGAAAPDVVPPPSWDKLVASVVTERQDRDLAAGRDETLAPAGYTDDPTEVLGPFDIGLWTVQGKESGLPPERVRGRAGGEPQSRRDARNSDDRQTRERPTGDGQSRRPTRTPAAEQEDRRLVAVVAAAGGGGDRPPGGGATRTAGSADRPPTSGDHIRKVIRGVGQTLMTVGLVMLLFAAYEVWFTGVLNGRSQDRLKSQLEQQWETGDDPVIAAQKPAKPGAKVRSIPLGDGFALIYVPDFGKDYVYTVIEGTDPAGLDEGPGHYVESALPGEVGNFAVAGHRVGKGSPFLNLDKLRAGSAVVIRTKTYWYTYRVLGDARTKDPKAVGPLGIPGMRIVSPAEVGVIAPVPGRSGVEPTKRLMTLTTCHPKFSARERLIIHAQLEGAPLPTGKGLPPALAAG